MSLQLSDCQQKNSDCRQKMPDCRRGMKDRWQRKLLGLAVLLLILPLGGAETAAAEVVVQEDVPKNWAGIAEVALHEGVQENAAAEVVSQETVQEDAVQEPAADGLSVADLNLEGIEQFINQLNDDLTEYMPELDFRVLLERISAGELAWDPGVILRSLGTVVFKEIAAEAALLGQLIILAVICAVLQCLQASFDRSSVGTIAYAVVYLALISMVIGSFSLALQLGGETIDKLGGFMQLLLPLILTLLTAMGHLTSAALLQPVLILMLNLVAVLIKTIVFPLLVCAAVLEIVSHISGRFNVSHLAGLMRSAGVWILGLMVTVFLGVLTIEGVAGAVADGVTLRTAKYAAGTFVPVVGKLFADVLETVVGTSLLLKNVIGLGGLIIIVLITVLPMVKLLALVVIYRLTAALVQPIGQEQLADALNGIAGSMTLVFAAVAVVCLMFFFVVAIIIGAGNLTVMLR